MLIFMARHELKMHHEILGDNFLCRFIVLNEPWILTAVVVAWTTFKYHVNVGGSVMSSCFRINFVSTIWFILFKGQWKIQKNDYVYLRIFFNHNIWVMFVGIIWFRHLKYAPDSSVSNGHFRISFILIHLYTYKMIYRIKMKDAILVQDFNVVSRSTNLICFLMRIQNI